MESLILNNGTASLGEIRSNEVACMTKQEKIDKKADEWGRIMTLMFPGTTYNPDTKMWNFASNKDAITAFTNYPEGWIDLRSFSYINE